MERVPLVLAEALCLPYKSQSPDLERQTKTVCIESRHGLSLKRIFDPQHNESKPPDKTLTHPTEHDQKSLVLTALVLGQSDFDAATFCCIEEDICIDRSI